jgi:hypothetical protein
VSDKGKSSRIRKTTKALGVAIQAPLTVRERLNKGLLPVAFVAGCLGMLALALCGILWCLPEERWPAALDPDRLPFYLMLSLLFASLLGWGCMQKGLSKLRKSVGWTVGGWLFVGAPLVCAAFLLTLKQGALGDPDDSTWLGLFGTVAYWYPPCLVASALFAYVTNRSRLGEQGRFERGFWFTLLVAPYALLMAYLIIGFHNPWIDERLQSTIHELGSGAIVAQVALAYFCGGGSSS